MNLKKIDAVILAGGKGSRIKKYLKSFPKPMIKVNGKNFISYLLQRLCVYNVNNIYILCGYRANSIIKKYHNKTINFTKIICIKEKMPLGTAGCLHQIFKKISKEFILVNGDTFLNIDYSKIIEKKINQNQSLMVIKKIDKNIASQKLNKLNVINGRVNIKQNGRYFNAGSYKLNKNIIKKIPKQFCSLEDEIIKSEIKKKLVIPFVYKGFFLDIGSPTSLKKSHSLMSTTLKKKAVFLDRDGTINEDYNYVYKKTEFHFRDGVIKGLEYLTRKNYYIFIVTNQAGIAKNKFTIKDFSKLHIWLKKKFLSKKIIIHDVKYCPYHKNAKNPKYKRNTLFRKPGNLMIENIKKNWDLDLKKSFYIGDKKKDKIAAEKSGLKFYYAKKNFYDQIKELTN